MPQALRSYHGFATTSTCSQVVDYAYTTNHTHTDMFRATRVLRAGAVANAAQAVKREVKSAGSGRDAVLQKGAKRDPELYVRGMLQ